MLCDGRDHEYTLQFIIVFGLVDAGCASEDKALKLLDSAATGAHQRLEKIQAEIKANPAHPWAGDYFTGDGLGVNVSLTIAPNSGYVFEWHSCLGLYDRNYGPIQCTSNVIRLSFTFENKREGFEGISQELVPIQWGPRSYLVSTDDIIGFCNNVNQGTEPRKGAHGLYLLR